MPRRRSARQPTPGRRIGFTGEPPSPVAREHEDETIGKSWVARAAVLAAGLLLAMPRPSSGPGRGRKPGGGSSPRPSQRPTPAHPRSGTTLSWSCSSGRCLVVNLIPSSCGHQTDRVRLRLRCTVPSAGNDLGDPHETQTPSSSLTAHFLALLAAVTLAPPSHAQRGQHAFAASTPWSRAKDYRRQRPRRVHPRRRQPGR